MDFEYLIIGIIFLLTGFSYIVYRFRYHTIKDDQYTGFQHGLEAAAIIIVLAIFIIWEEIEKII